MVEANVKSIPIFETHDLDFASYLMLQGLKYIDSTLETTEDSKPRVVMRFFDEKSVIRDLERAYMSSEHKRLVDFRRYLLKEVHRTMRNGPK